MKKTSVYCECGRHHNVGPRAIFCPDDKRRGKNERYRLKIYKYDAYAESEIRRNKDSILRLPSIDGNEVFIAVSEYERRVDNKITVDYVYEIRYRIIDENRKRYFTKRGALIKPSEQTDNKLKDWFNKWGNLGGKQQEIKSKKIIAESKLLKKTSVKKVKSVSTIKTYDKRDIRGISEEIIHKAGQYR